MALKVCTNYEEKNKPKAFVDRRLLGGYVPVHCTDHGGHVTADVRNVA